ncbi:MAG: Hpt domain-containing protein [Tenuifilaceae bacterium]|nr:Hpt domain-containing protein [Tenuifilaceae bacterium]
MYKHIDVTKLDEISAGSKELIHDLVQLFTRQAIEFGQRFETLLRDKDYAQLAKFAHKVKGSVSTLGMNNLALKMKELEELAKANDSKGEAKNLIEHFKTVSNEAIDELNAILNRQ